MDLLTYVFDTGAHGCSGNVADVSALEEVIVQGHVKKVVSAVGIGRVGLEPGVVSPSQPMAVNGPLGRLSVVAVIPHEEEGSTQVFISCDGSAVVGIDITEIGVVSGVLVHTFCVVGCLAVAVVVPCLPISNPTTHGSVHLTRRTKVVNLRGPG